MGERLQEPQLSHIALREKPVLSDKYRDAMYSLSGPVYLNGFDDEFSVKQSHSLHTYEGNRDMKDGFHKTKSIATSFPLT